MLVKDIMTADCIVVNEFSYLDQVFNLINEKGINHLPVVDDNKKLVGMISDRDLRNVADNREDVPVFPRLTISDIMTKNLETVKPEDTAIHAAKIINDHEFHSLPVVDDANTLVGLLTIRDVLRGFVNKSIK